MPHSSVTHRDVYDSNWVGASTQHCSISIVPQGRLFAGAYESYISNLFGYTYKYVRLSVSQAIGKTPSDVPASSSKNASQRKAACEPNPTAVPVIQLVPRLQSSDKMKGRRCKGENLTQRPCCSGLDARSGSLFETAAGPCGDLGRLLLSRNFE